MTPKQQLANAQIEFAKTQSEEIVTAYILEHGFPSTHKQLLIFSAMFWIVGNKFSKENLS